MRTDTSSSDYIRVISHARGKRQCSDNGSLGSAWLLRPVWQLYNDRPSMLPDGALTCGASILTQHGEWGVNDPVTRSHLICQRIAGSSHREKLYQSSLERNIMNRVARCLFLLSAPFISRITIQSTSSLQKPSNHQTNPLAPKLGFLVWITHSISLAKGDLGFTLVDLVLHENFPSIFRLEITNESRIPQFRGHT
jgi:hypothetical protein